MHFVWIASLIGGLAQAMSGLVGRVLLSLGLGYVIYSGVDVALATIKTEIFQSLLAVHPDVLSMLGAMKVGNAINIVFSAYAARMTLNGLTGGNIKRLVQK